MEHTGYRYQGTHTGPKPPMEGSSVINVGKLERLVSIGLGMGLLCGAMRSNGFLKYAAILGAGGYLFYRGMSGNCPITSFLGICGGDGRNMQGKEAAQIEIKSHLTVDRTREATYAFWRKLENLPRFMRHLERVEAIDDRRSRWTAKFPGSPVSINWDAEIIRDEEGSAIGWRSLPGSAIENAGEVVFRDAPANSGTVLDVHISYRPPAGNVGEGIARLLNPVLEDLIREDITNFKHYIESSEMPT